MAQLNESRRIVMNVFICYLDTIRENNSMMIDIDIDIIFILIDVIYWAIQFMQV